MPTNLKRAELDRLAAIHSLNSAGVESMLDLAGARPSSAESVLFLARTLRLGGLLSLAAGIVFFVAANWSRVAIFGRFALIEIIVIACAALALWKPPPRIVGRGALFLAFIATGALLALFGQTYQTGADVYELFLTWALLGLPLVLLAQWSVTAATWVLVFNVALLLFCGWPSSGGLFWALLGSPHFRPAWAILGAGFVNLLLWYGFDARRVPSVPDWVRRLIVTCAFVHITWAGVLGAVASEDFGYGEHTDLGVLAGFVVAIGAVIAYALQRRNDIYPLALVTLAFIIVSMAGIARVFDFNDEGVFFLLALWLIGVSTVGGKVLLILMRRWRVAPA